MPLTVHLLDPPQPRLMARLHSRLRGAVDLLCGPRFHDPARFQVLVAGRPTAEQLDASPELQTLIVPWAGLPEGTRHLLLERPQLTVYNLHHNAAATAEMAMALLLAASKSLVPCDQALRAHDWTPRYDGADRSLQLDGRRALVLGLGSIGRRVARACRGLGMRVTAVRRSGPWKDADVDAVHPPDALAGLLPEADVLLICLPATPETRGLIGADQLAALPENALLVNVSRGSLVDEAALFAALKEGQLFGAGLDVWYRYPQAEADRANTPPSELPFGELENVVLSPHRGGHVRRTEELRMDHLADVLVALAEGRALRPLDVQAGY